MTIRPATADDAAAIAEVNVQAWRESYPGLVPDAVLAALDPGRRVEGLRAAIPRGGAFVAADDTDLVGFVIWGPQRDALLPFGAEIYGLYVLRRAQWRGLGRALLGEATADMRKAGFDSVGLWVFDGNVRARRFYETLGGRLCATRHRTRDGWTSHETAYGWDDLTSLIPACARLPWEEPANQDGGATG